MRYTVIIPTQNRPELVARALRSVHAQTCPADEIVVIDDASEVPLVLPENLRDSRTHVIRIENAGGAAAARNAGLLRVTNPVVAFLDDDDEWLPTKMQKQLAFFHANPDAVLVSCGHLRIEGGSEYREIFSEDFVRRFCHYDNYFGSFSYLAIRRDIRKTLLDPALPALQDWDFALRATRDGRFGVIEEALVKYHAHELPRITNRRMNHVKGLRRCYFNHRDSFSKDARRWILSRVIFERSRHATGVSRRVKKVAFSVALAIRCALPWSVKLRSIVRKIGSLVFDNNHLAAFRSFSISTGQRWARSLSFRSISVPSV